MIELYAQYISEPQVISCLNIYNSPYANVRFLPVTATYAHTLSWGAMSSLVIKHLDNSSCTGHRGETIGCTFCHSGMYAYRCIVSTCLLYTYPQQSFRTRPTIPDRFNEVWRIGEKEYAPLRVRYQLSGTVYFRTLIRGIGDSELKQF